MGNSVPLLVQVLVGLGVGLPAFLGGMFARRKSSADVEVTLSAEARQWANSFAEGARTAMEQARVAATRAKDCQDRCDAMERHIGRLEALLREHGIAPPVPPWTEGVNGG